MRTAKIAIFRLALLGCLGLVPVLGLPVQRAQAAAPPERILPDTTVFMVKLNDAKAFRAAFRGSQYGQLWNDPSLKDFREELGHKLTDATKDLKEKIGLSLSDLVELPQGTLTVAAITKDSAREEVAASSLPVDIVIMADAGENEKKMLEALERATKQGEASGRQSLDRVVQRAHAAHRPVPAARAAESRCRKRKGQAPARPAADLDQLGKYVLCRHRSGRHQRPDCPSRGSRQLARRKRGLYEDAGEDRFRQVSGRLVSRRQQAHQGRDQGQHQGSRRRADRGLGP